MLGAVHFAVFCTANRTHGLFGAGSCTTAVRFRSGNRIAMRTFIPVIVIVLLKNTVIMVEFANHRVLNRNLIRSLCIRITLLAFGALPVCGVAIRRTGRGLRGNGHQIVRVLELRNRCTGSYLFSAVLTVSVAGIAFTFFRRSYRIADFRLSVLCAVQLAVFKGFIALFAADGAALIIYSFLRAGSRRFQIGGICFLYIIVAAFRTAAVIKYRVVGCRRQLSGIPFPVDLRVTFKRIRINGHSEQSADITAAGHIFAIAVRMLIMAVILVDNSIIAKRLSGIFKAQAGRNDGETIRLCCCFVICLDDREVLISIILPGTPRPNLMNHQTRIRAKAFDILDQLRQIDEAGSIKRRIAFLLKDNNIPVHVFQSFLNGCTILRIRRIPACSFPLYGRTLSGGIGDFKFKYSLVVSRRLVMPRNRTRRKFEITKSQRKAVHRCNFRRITRSVFRETVADGQNLERIIWFRLFGLFAAPELELPDTRIRIIGRVENSHIFDLLANRHIHRDSRAVHILRSHQVPLRIQIVQRIRSVNPVIVRDL